MISERTSGGNSLAPGRKGGNSSPAWAARASRSQTKARARPIGAPWTERGTRRAPLAVEAARLLDGVAPGGHAGRVGPVVPVLVLRVSERAADPRAADAARRGADGRAGARAPDGGADRRARSRTAHRADERAHPGALGGVGRGIKTGLLLGPRHALIHIAGLLLGGLSLRRIRVHRRLRPGAARDRDSERDHDQPCQHAFHFRSSLCFSVATLSLRGSTAPRPSLLRRQPVAERLDRDAGL